MVFREILAALCRHMSEKKMKSITFNAFFDLCVGEMIIHDENQLHQNLREVIDHRILKEIRKENIIEYEITDLKNLSSELEKDLGKS